MTDWIEDDRAAKLDASGNLWIKKRAATRFIGFDCFPKVITLNFLRVVLILHLQDLFVAEVFADLLEVGTQVNDGGFVLFVVKEFSGFVEKLFVLCVNG